MLCGDSRLALEYATSVPEIGAAVAKGSGTAHKMPVLGKAKLPANTDIQHWCNCTFPTAESFSAKDK